jgi:hypothetical protein
MTDRFFLPKALAIAALVGGMTVATAAGAVDVQNDDAKEYTVTLTEPGGKQTVKLGPGETKMDICAVCSVSIEGAAAVQGSGLDKVIIKDGKLTKVDG